MEKLTLIKAGGKVLDSEIELAKLLNLVASIEGKKILVHGGGIFIDALCNQLNIPTQMVNGRRITSPENMDVVLMACAGKLNKKLVAGLNKRGTTAIGLTGGDLNLITSHKRNPEPVDFGMVGDIDAVNTQWLQWLIQKDAVPVIASITQSNEFELLNTNADTIAAHLAISMAEKYAVELFFYFDKPGVLKNAEDNLSVIKQLSIVEFEEMKQNNKIHSGMLPKLQNGFYALNNKVQKVNLGMELNKGTQLILNNKKIKTC
jgi:acetylglutamate kinase